MSGQVSLIKSRVKTVLTIGFRTILTLGLVAIIIEEALPEPVAKPIVVTTAVTALVYNLWSWHRSPRRIR